MEDECDVALLRREDLVDVDELLEAVLLGVGDPLGHIEESHVVPRVEVGTAVLGVCHDRHVHASNLREIGVVYLHARGGDEPAGKLNCVGVVG